MMTPFLLRIESLQRLSGRDFTSEFPTGAYAMFGGRSFAFLAYVPEQPTVVTWVTTASVRPNRRNPAPHPHAEEKVRNLVFHALSAI